MNIENLRDPNLWEYVGRRITTRSWQAVQFAGDFKAES